jgi:hypothetical protein
MEKKLRDYEICVILVSIKIAISPSSYTFYLEQQGFFIVNAGKLRT